MNLSGGIQTALQWAEYQPELSIPHENVEPCRALLPSLVVSNMLQTARNMEQAADHLRYRLGSVCPEEAEAIIRNARQVYGHCSVLRHAAKHINAMEEQ